jgi:hypothetical protein
MSVCRYPLGSLFTPTLTPAAWTTCCLCRATVTAAPDLRRVLVVLAVVARRPQEAALTPRRIASRWESSELPPRRPSRDGPELPRRFPPGGF